MSDPVETSNSIPPSSSRTPSRRTFVWLAVAFVVLGAVVVVVNALTSESDNDTDATGAVEVVQGTGAVAAADSAGGSGSTSETYSSETTQVAEVVADGPGNTEFELLAGGTSTVTQLQDSRPVVVNFFASWCGPCRAEMPELEQAHQQYGSQVAFLGLALNDTTERAKELVAETGVTFPTGTDPNGAISDGFGILGMPTTLFIDSDGNVQEQHTGQVTGSQLQDFIGELLAGDES